MKIVKMYVDFRKNPIGETKCGDDKMLKHAIANLALTHFEDVPDVSKVRFIIEEGEA